MFSKEDGLDAAPGGQVGTGLSLPRLGTGTQQQGLEIKQAKGEQPAGECSRALLSRFLSPLSGQTCLSPCAQPWGWPEVLSRTRTELLTPVPRAEVWICWPRWDQTCSLMWGEVPTCPCPCLG